MAAGRRHIARGKQHEHDPTERWDGRPRSVAWPYAPRRRRDDRTASASASMPTARRSAWDGASPWPYPFGRGPERLLRAWNCGLPLTASDGERRLSPMPPGRSGSPCRCRIPGVARVGVAVAPHLAPAGASWIWAGPARDNQTLYFTRGFTVRGARSDASRNHVRRRFPRVPQRYGDRLRYVISTSPHDRGAVVVASDRHERAVRGSHERHRARRPAGSARRWYGPASPCFRD